MMMGGTIGLKGKKRMALVHINLFCGDTQRTMTGFSKCQGCEILGGKSQTFYKL